MKLSRNMYISILMYKLTALGVNDLKYIYNGVLWLTQNFIHEMNDCASITFPNCYSSVKFYIW